MVGKLCNIVCMQRSKQFLFSIIAMSLSMALCLVAAEAFIRLKNSSMTNYDIEMWRYANLLKIRSDDPAIDFDHVRSKTATLQNVEIRLNKEGLRGPELEAKPARRILFLGGSITLGWGVPEKETVEARLQQMFAEAGQKVEILNGGVGNYNTERYVSRFFKNFTALEPTDIVVHYFLRDAETLPPGGGNWFLRHSQIALTLWIATHRLFDKQGEETLVQHYKTAYEPDAPGFKVMQQQLQRLADYARVHNIRLTLAMVPDVHNLKDYPFSFIHEIMKSIAERNGYRYVDLLPALQGRSPEELWAMPGDPHPNALGHELMAQALFPVLKAAGK